MDAWTELGAEDDALSERIAQTDWHTLGVELDAQGWAVLPRLISVAECIAVTALYDRDEAFRSRVIMARHGYGSGEYRYFSYPLPSLVQSLRSELYPRLMTTANAWHERLGLEPRFSGSHEEFLARCHEAGQVRPTPLLLRYAAGDYNCLHQDLYGEHVFPLQVALLLSAPGRDFAGGEFLLTEQRPRAQSRGTVVPLAQGDALVFSVRHRPVRGVRGDHRVTMRHGVSQVLSGSRHTLGIIFHDAA
ncbi:MAG: 2OG-Fe(II) oxygenase [Pseudomonadota bacterium]